MKRIPTNIILLNILCLILLSLLCVFAWSQLAASTQYFDNDYKTFYGSLHRSYKPYHIQEYVRVLSVQKLKGGGEHLQTSSPLSAINMDSPLMTLVLKALVNVSDSLSTNIMAFVLVSLWCAGLSLFVLSRLFDKADLNFYFLPLLLIFMLTWPSLYTLKLGQVTFLVLPFLCLSYLFLSQQKWVLMTVMLALVAALKLFFLIFVLYFISRRQWRLLLIFIASFLIFSFLPLLYFSKTDYIAFINIARHFALFADRARLPMNASLLSVITNSVNFLGLRSSLVGMQIAFTILTLYVVIRWLIYDNKFLQSLPEFSSAFSFCFLILIALLCSPLAWIYYLVFLVVPFTLFVKISQRTILPQQFYSYFIAALIFPCFAWLSSLNPIIQLIVHISGFIGLVFWVMCLHLAAKTVMNSDRTASGSPKKLFIICFAYAVFNIFLLYVGYGMPYFLDFNQKNYFEHTAPAITVRASS